MSYLYSLLIVKFAHDLEIVSYAIQIINVSDDFDDDSFDFGNVSLKHITRSWNYEKKAIKNFMEFQIQEIQSIWNWFCKEGLFKLKFNAWVTLRNVISIELKDFITLFWSSIWEMKKKSIKISMFNNQKMGLNFALTYSIDAWGGAFGLKEFLLDFRMFSE